MACIAGLISFFFGILGVVYSTSGSKKRLAFTHRVRKWFFVRGWQQGV
jgi:hypothetical protein